MNCYLGRNLNRIHIILKFKLYITIKYLRLTNIDTFIGEY